MTKEVLKYWKHSWKEVLYLSLHTHIHAQLLISVDRDQAARPFEALHSFIEIWKLTELDYVIPWTKNSGKLFCLSKPKVLKFFRNSQDMYRITGKSLQKSVTFLHCEPNRAFTVTVQTSGHLQLGAAIHWSFFYSFFF